MPETQLPEPLSPASGYPEDAGPASEAVGLSPWLERTRLTAALDFTECCPITLVCAAAGWGKTAMLTEWRRAAQGRTTMLWYAGGVEDGVSDRELWARIVRDLTELG